MEANINVNIRMNRELKKQFEAFCNDVGINMTTAFTMFVKKTLMEQRIPFDIGFDKPHGRELAGILEELREMRQYPEHYKTYASSEDMLEDILK